MSTSHGIPKGSLWGFHLKYFRPFWCSSLWALRWSGQLLTMGVRQVMRRLILWGLGFISPSTPALPPCPISLRSRLTLRPALMLAQFRFSLILLLGPLTGAAGVDTVVSYCQFDPSVLFLPLPSLLILGATFYSLKKCSTESGILAPQFRHIASPRR